MCDTTQASGFLFNTMLLVSDPGNSYVLSVDTPMLRKPQMSMCMCWGQGWGRFLFIHF